MQVHESFDVRRGIGVYRAAGECNLVEAVDLAKRAIGLCRDRGLDRLLVIAGELHGFSIPTLVDRFLAAEEWADVAQGAVAIALVVDEKYIHPHKFAVKVASDLGLAMDVFTSDAHALQWLGHRGPAPESTP